MVVIDWPLLCSARAMSFWMLLRSIIGVSLMPFMLRLRPGFIHRCVGNNLCNMQWQTIQHHSNHMHLAVRFAPEPWCVSRVRSFFIGALRSRLLQQRLMADALVRTGCSLSHGAVEACSGLLLLASGSIDNIVSARGAHDNHILLFGENIQYKKIFRKYSDRLEEAAFRSLRASDGSLCDPGSSDASLDASLEVRPGLIAPDAVESMQR